MPNRKELQKVLIVLLFAAILGAFYFARKASKTLPKQQQYERVSDAGANPFGRLHHVM